MFRSACTVASIAASLMLVSLFSSTAQATPSFPSVQNVAWITAPGFIETNYDDNVDYDINHAPPQRGDVTLYKDPLKAEVELGDVLPWRIHGRSDFPFELIDVRIVDLLPAGVSFVPGTARLSINGVQQAHPSISQIDQMLIIQIPSMPTGLTFSLTFDSVVSVAFEGDSATNRAQVRSSFDTPLSDLAEGTARIRTNEAFDCSSIIGRVFNDLNVNGYSDDGEQGVPGPRLYALVNGTTLSVQTDNYGRYHIPCADSSRKAQGTNVIVKLDERTLPSGYRLTSENPRSLRVTPGKISRLNFGVTIGRVLSVDLNDCVFEGSVMRLDHDNVSGLVAVADQLASGATHARLTLRTASADPNLSKARVESVLHLLNRVWSKKNQGALPEIEVETIRLVGQAVPQCH